MSDPVLYTYLVYLVCLVLSLLIGSLYFILMMVGRIIEKKMKEENNAQEIQNNPR